MERRGFLKSLLAASALTFVPLPKVVPAGKGIYNADHYLTLCQQIALEIQKEEDEKIFRAINAMIQGA
jgi:hypothetical protein